MLVDPNLYYYKEEKSVKYSYVSLKGCSELGRLGYLADQI